MELFHLFKLSYPKHFEIKKGLEILELDVPSEFGEEILNEISLYLFDNTQTNNGTKVFDYELDYKYYYVDFLELGIDLNERDISWWEFDAILEGIFLQKNSRISQVIQYRTYKKPSKNSKMQEQEEYKYNMEKKKQYALPVEENAKKVENGLNSLWGFLASRNRKE